MLRTRTRMDSDRFAAELEAWMRDSGQVRNIRTRLRTDLVQAMLGKKRGGAGDKSAPAPAPTRALHSLLLEHLSRSGLWYSASVLSSEADLLLEGVSPAGPSNGPPPQHPSSLPKLSDEQVARVLSALDLRGLSADPEALKVDYYRRAGASLLECLLRSGDRGSGSGSSAVLRRLEGIERMVRRREEDRRVARKVDRLRRTVEKKDSTAQEEQEEDISQVSQTSHATTQTPSVVTGSGSPREESSRGTGSPEAEDHDIRSEAKELRVLLDEARREIKDLREREAAREKDLLRTLEAQKEEIAKMRRLLEETRASSAPNPNIDFAPRGLPGDLPADGHLADFLSDVRARVGLLHKSSQEIDKEFSKL